MDDKDRENPDNLQGGANGVLGAALGGGAGTMYGAAIGAGLAGPVGMLVGGGVGTVLGAMIGYAIDYDSREPEFRQYHESAHPQGEHTFEQASPAYRYGWESQDKPKFRDQTYEEARPALRQGWTDASRFADYEIYIQQGWEHRAAVKAAGSLSPSAQE
jgi:phage tail tape-measure protein